MRSYEIFILAVGLSMDAFAVAVGIGLSMARASLKRAVVVGLYFGGFQAGMPLIGFFAASLFADRFLSYGPWVAFGLLVFFGSKMVVEGLKGDGGSKVGEGVVSDGGGAGGGVASDGGEVGSGVASDGYGAGGGSSATHSLKPVHMLPLAVATSIDALAVGVSFSLLQVGIFFAVLLIGVVTFAISVAGVKVGSLFGGWLKSKAQVAGGVVLVLIGLRILLEHLGVF